MDVAGCRVTIMGLGRHGGGVAAARYLAGRGAIVTVTDLAGEQRLAGSLDQLADLPIARLRLGRHNERDFRGADLVVANPAVKPHEPLLRVARQHGAQVTTEIELFLSACPARIVGVTGSNGKSTTAAMIAAILKAAGRRTWLGGNIGGSLLGELDHIRPGDWVVLELSSFQLARLAEDSRGVEVAVVTGCTPNHLDWHGRMEDYIAAKQRILTAQTGESAAVLNVKDAEVASWHGLVGGRCIPLASRNELPPLAIPGEHNRTNAALAAAAARAVGCDEPAIAGAVAQFRGLPHRLEPVGKVAGRTFYNDSMATTPDSVIAALDALEVPVWLLAGGYDKGGDYGPMAGRIVRKARGAAFYGAARDLLHGQVSGLDAMFPCRAVESLTAAFAWCWENSRPGDAILLSPACASFDQFADYAERGRAFVRLVESLGDMPVPK